MKLTWFGGTTIRVHIGGSILVADPAGAPGNVDRVELVAGADATFGLRAEGEAMPLADPLDWQPRRPPALLDEDDEDQDVFLWRLAGGGVLIDAVGEPPLLLVTGAFGAAGRWARDAVVVILGGGPGTAGIASNVLDALAPRLMALAASEAAIDATFAALRDRLNGTALVALEPGLALEV